MITDLAHAAFKTQDLERCLTFYALLGIHEAFRLNHADGLSACGRRPLH
ncbi:MAG: hypothetical protein H7095_01800 [Pseudopedobacter sp.]|nr:hypothetical protein [Deinococcales bacterium]